MKSSLVQIILAGILCVALGAAYGVWYSIIGEKSAAVADLETQISTKTDTINRIASARASLAEISGDEAIMQGYFVPESGVVSFITNLETLGQAQKAEVSVLSVASNKSGAQPTLTFSLNVSGAFDAVMRTVGAIEYAPYDLSISAFSLAQNDKNNWQALLTLVVGSIAPVVATSTPRS